MNSGRKSFLQSLLEIAGAGLLLATACYGQARPTATGPGSLVTLGATASAFQIDYGDRYLGGLGIYADVNPTWRYGIEGEARFLRINQEADTHLSTYLAGPRISLRPHRINPYVKVLVGLGKFNFPYDYAYGSYFVVAPGVGVDYRLNQRFKIRVIDFEYQEWPGFTFGAIRPYGFSTGISYSILRARSKLSN
jgi:hypothetical protein